MSDQSNYGAVQSPAIMQGTAEIVELFKQLYEEALPTPPIQTHVDVQTDHERDPAADARFAELQEVNRTLQKELDAEKAETYKLAKEVARLTEEIARLIEENTRLSSQSAPKIEDVSRLESEPAGTLPLTVSPQDTLLCEPLFNMNDMTYPDFTAPVLLDRETLQPQDLIEDYGIDPYVHPDVFCTNPAFATPVSSPSSDHDQLAEEGTDETMRPKSDPDSSSSSNDDMEWDSSSDTERDGSPLREGHLPFPSRVFTPAARMIHRVRLVVSPSRPAERRTFYISPPSSPTSDHSADD